MSDMKSPTALEDAACIPNNATHADGAVGDGVAPGGASCPAHLTEEMIAAGLKTIEAEWKPGSNWRNMVSAVYQAMRSLEPDLEDLKIDEDAIEDVEAEFRIPNAAFAYTAADVAAQASAKKPAQAPLGQRALTPATPSAPAKPIPAQRSGGPTPGPISAGRSSTSGGSLRQVAAATAQGTTGTAAPIFTYKSHVLVGVREDGEGEPRVIAFWPHLPSQAEIDKTIAQAKYKYTEFALTSPVNAWVAKT